MKKINSYFIAITVLISFSFYSCASKSSSEDTFEPSITIDENISESDNLESENETGDNENLISDITAVEENLENLDQSVNEDNFVFPEEIEEPDVFEEEAVENEEVINIPAEEDETDENEAEELIELDNLDEISDEFNHSNLLNSEGENLIESEENDFIEVSDAESENITISENTEDITTESEESIEADFNSSDLTSSDFIEENVNQDLISEDSFTEEESEEQSELQEEIQIEEIIPSRKVVLKRGEYLDVIYPGNGWIYVGVTDGSKDITYNGRKLGTENTTFTLIGKVPGTKIVHFYKTDNLTGEYIDDYIEVEILKERTTSKEHQIAPSYEDVVPSKPRSLNAQQINNKSEEKSDNNNPDYDSDIIDLTEDSDSNSSDDDIIFLDTTSEKSQKINKQNDVQKNSSNQDFVLPDSTNIENNISENLQFETNNYETTSSIDPDKLLKDIHEAFDEKNYENALKLIEDYINLSAKKLDEIYYLKGQIYEAQTGIQNINNAVSEYEKIISLYPTSKYWEKANKRIIYLKRFYLEVR